MAANESYKTNSRTTRKMHFYMIGDIAEAKD